MCTAPATAADGERFPHVCALCRELIAVVDANKAGGGDAVALTRVARGYLLVRARALVQPQHWPTAATALAEEGIDPAALGPPDGTTGPTADPVLLAEALRGLRNACTDDDFRRFLHTSAAGSTILEIAAGVAALSGGASLAPGTLAAPVSGRLPPGLRQVANSEYASLAVRHALSFCINYSASYELAHVIDLVDRGLFRAAMDGLRRHEPVVAEFQVWLVRNLSRDTRCGAALPACEAAAPGTRDALFLLLGATAPAVEFSAAAVANLVAQDPDQLVPWLAEGRSAGALVLAVAALLDHPVAAVAAVAARLTRFVAAADPARAADGRFDLMRRLVDLASTSEAVGTRDAAAAALAAILNRCHYALTTASMASQSNSSDAQELHAHGAEALAEPAAGSEAAARSDDDGDAEQCAAYETRLAVAEDVCGSSDALSASPEPGSGEDVDDIARAVATAAGSRPAATIAAPPLTPNPEAEAAVDALAACDTPAGSVHGSDGDECTPAGRPLAPPPLMPADGAGAAGISVSRMWSRLTASHAPAAPVDRAHTALCHATVQALGPDALGAIVRHGATGGALSVELVCALVAELLRFTQSAQTVLSAHRAVRGLLTVAVQSSVAAKTRAREVMKLFRAAWKRLRADEACPFSR